MNSKSTIHAAETAFVWIWLPGSVQPIVAGRIQRQGEYHHFVYGRSYLAREDAIPLSPLELPLESKTFTPAGLNRIHSCLRDSAPDAWGRRVIGYRYKATEVGELDYMLLSGSDRIGALDFQASSNVYTPRDMVHPNLEDLYRAADIVDRKEKLPPELDYALLHGSSVGGARPKALITDNESGKGYIAKFSSSTDSYDIVKAEYVAMRLAQLAGLQVAHVQMHRVLGKDVLLVERFDRVSDGGGVFRRHMLSALTLLGLNEMEAQYASYRDLADTIRKRFAEPNATLRELYTRMIVNILLGNVDDHARNHAAFWDGQVFTLTPAYDICPQARTGQEASQAMDIGGKQGKLSTLTNLLSVCSAFHLAETEAKELINATIATIRDNWTSVCEEADLAPTERARLWEGAVFNPFCFFNWK